MVWLRLFPLYISILLLCAHYFRSGDYSLIAFWAAVPFLLILKRKWATRAVQLLIVGGAAIWIETIVSIFITRQMAGMPWLRMTVILGIVVLFTIGSALAFEMRRFRQRFLSEHSYAASSLIGFIITFATLSIVQLKVSFPLLILERFISHAGWLEILILSTYAGWLVEKMLDTAQTPIWRRRIWLVFSVVFFVQLILGLAGYDKFLMTGRLHIPVPAVIIAGPIFRGGGLFMPILFLSTIILVGPAWCSYLCYIGSWDHAAALSKKIPKPLPGWRHSARLTILVIIPLVAIAMRAFGISSMIAAFSAIAFGLIGIIIMLVWSRKIGAMAHCLTWCPIGLLTNWLGKISPFRLQINNSCTDCGACAFACRYDALYESDIINRRPGLTCTLCGDCLTRCRENSIEYRFFKLSPAGARTVFMIMVICWHAISLGVARI